MRDSRSRTLRRCNSFSLSESGSPQTIIRQSDDATALTAREIRASLTMPPWLLCGTGVLRPLSLGASVSPVQQWAPSRGEPVGVGLRFTKQLRHTRGTQLAGAVENISPRGNDGPDRTAKLASSTRFDSAANSLGIPPSHHREMVSYWILDSRPKATDSILRRPRSVRLLHAVFSANPRRRD